MSEQLEIKLPAPEVKEEQSIDPTSDNINNTENTTNTQAHTELSSEISVDNSTDIKTDIKTEANTGNNTETQTEVNNENNDTINSIDNDQVMDEGEQAPPVVDTDALDQTEKHNHNGLEYIESQLTTSEFIPQIFQAMHVLKVKETINNSNNMETQTANIKHKIKLCKNYIATENTLENNINSTLAESEKDVPLSELLSKTPEQWETDIQEVTKELELKQDCISSLQQKIKELLPGEM